MSLKKPLLVVGLCGAIAAIPYSRQAQAMFGEDAAIVIPAIVALQAALSSLMESLLSVNIGNVGATDAAETTRAIAASRQIEQGEMAAMVRLASERARAQAAEDRMPSPLWEEAATTTLMMRSQDAVGRSRSQRRAAMLVERSGRPRPLDDIADLHFGVFCPGPQRERGMCSTLVDPTLQLTNISVGALLSPGDGQYETLSTNEVIAAELLTETITTPTVPALIPPTPGAGEVWSGLDLADRAALSASSYSYSSLISSRERKHAAPSER